MVSTSWEHGDQKQGKIVDEILNNYEKFNDELKTELSLKRIWTIVEESD